MRHSKRFQSAAAVIESERNYGISDAVAALKESATAGFDETAELSMNLGIRPAQTVVRGTCNLPHGTGKTVRVIAFAKGESQAEAEAAGADEVGGEDLAKRIQEGWLEFDKVVASPDMMPVVGKLGKLLGPRGLMPSPKTGTVTKDVGRAVSELKSGMVEFRTDRYGVIHTVFGKASFDVAALRENLEALLRSIGEARPEEGIKGRYIKKAAISSTMGPGIHLDLTEVASVAEGEPA
ncbi:MAG: 50S ribosomal protein L1 [Candidatus Bipolaricaulota bacterium]|nr:MAG: 50S ribosomal protein L1 [Candidatus Bipolaricaulota bacterium]